MSHDKCFHIEIARCHVHNLHMDTKMVPVHEFNSTSLAGMHAFILHIMTLFQIFFIQHVLAILNSSNNIFFHLPSNEHKHQSEVLTYDLVELFSSTKMNLPYVVSLIFSFSKLRNNWSTTSQCIHHHIPFSLWTIFFLPCFFHVPFSISITREKTFIFHLWTWGFSNHNITWKRKPTKLLSNFNIWKETQL